MKNPRVEKLIFSNQEVRNAAAYLDQEIIEGHLAGRVHFYEGVHSDGLRAQYIVLEGDKGGNSRAA